MLIEAMNRADLSRTLLSQEGFHPFPRYEEREAWQALAPEVRSYYLALGEGLEDCSWPELSAGLYMDFFRNGNRRRYEIPYSRRRKMLYTLLVAECVEGRGRFVDDIINGVWAICEESTWVLPAHNNRGSAAGHTNALVDREDTPWIVDLFAAETASLLSWVYALLGNRLAMESPLVPRRIALEINRRVVDPYEQCDDYGWMGFTHDRPVNNWNPWINSNVLAAVLNIEAQGKRREALVRRIGRSAQRFLDSYAPDGGCDEGPAYFNAAGASMLDILGLCEDATQGAVNLYGDPLIQNMGKYIMHMHIAGPWHVNFADAAAQIRPDAMLLWRTGIKTGQADLAAYARGALAKGFAAPPYQPLSHTIYRQLRNLFQYDRRTFEGAPLTEAMGHFFPSIQVMTARSRVDGDKGLFLAAKGGHNGESHNHNDIGSYLIALDGEPVIADAGVGVYTKDTFSGMRYTIWSMQSGYHNTAILNGCDQRPGKAFHAGDVDYEDDGEKAVLSLDMAAAYGMEAGVTSYRRRCMLDRGADRIVIHDSVALSKADEPIAVPLLCAVEPRLDAGCIRLGAAERTLAVHYDAEGFCARAERIALSDANLRAGWGRDQLFRVLLIRRDIARQDDYVLTFTIEE